MDGRKLQVVLLIHGIRTRAYWQHIVRQTFEEDGLVRVVPIGYGRFDVFRFILPGPSRRKPIDTIHRKIRSAISAYQSDSSEVSIIAHSFGTYSVAKVLQENRDIIIKNLILCGSIISDNYDWGATKRQITGFLINDYGTLDIWPAVANSVTWGYGNTGTYGFKSPEINDRPHRINHSDFLNKEFSERFWKSAIIEQTVINSDIKNPKDVSSPWYFSIFDIPFKWAIPALALFFTSTEAYQSLYSTQEITTDRPAALFQPAYSAPTDKNPPPKDVTVLAVVDDSSSMEAGQKKFSRSLIGFLDKLNENNISYAVCLLTTDYSFYKGDMVPWFEDPNGAPLTFILTDEHSPNTVVETTINKIGHEWSSDEQAVGQISAFADKESARQCLARSKYLEIIVISDEDERSVGGQKARSDVQYKPLGPENFPANAIKKLREKYSYERIFWNSIIVIPGDKECEANQDSGGIPSFPGSIYMNASQETGGELESICRESYDDFFNSIFIRIRLIT